MRRALGLVFAVAFILSCSRGPDPATALPGTWVASDPVAMAFAFASGGRFQAQAVGEDDVDEGTYTIEGDRITFHHGPSPRMQVDQAFRMKWEGSDRVKLTFIPGDSSIKGAMAVTFDLKRQGSKQQLDRRAVAEVKDTQRLAQSGTERCLSNLKQIALGMALYSQDYDDAWVGPSWPKDLMPYVKNATVFDCPTVLAAGGSGGYALNSDLAGRVERHLSNPATVPAVFDSDAGPVAEPSATPNPRRHPEGNNVGYADGHVATLP